MPGAASIMIGPAAVGMRLDQFLAGRYPDRSRAFFQRLIAAGEVRIGGRAMEKRHLLSAGERVDIRWPAPATFELHPEAINLDILYSDDDILVIDKPAGLTVHPGAGTRQGTLVNALLDHDYHTFAALSGDNLRPGIVHRLDKDTSGVMVVARNEHSCAALGRGFSERTVVKEYLALACGRLPQARARVDQPIGRNPRNRKKMAVVQRNGKQSVTRFRELAAANRLSIVLARPATGRTHQIRVHLAWLGCPVLGDHLYAGRRGAGLSAGRHMLHAWRLTLTHPHTQRRLRFTAPLPADMCAAATAADLDMATATSALENDPAENGT